MEKNKLKFISEIASTHNGNIDVVKKLTDNHLNSKSNYIKYQIFDPNNLIFFKEKNFNKFKKIFIPFNEWEKIINKYSGKTKIILEIFDEKSYNFAEKFKKKVLLKISCSEADNLKLINKAIKNFKKIFINFSGFEKKEFSKILNKIKDKKKIVVLYGFQSYPSDSKDLRFEIFDFLKKKKIEYGFSDHSRYGFNDELLTNLLISIKKNCKYFEKHICENIKKKPIDYISSVEIKDLNKLIEIVRKYEKNLNKKNNFKMSKKELTYKENMRKKAISIQELKKGEKIFEKIIFLRTSKKQSLFRNEIKKTQKTKKKLSKFTVIKKRDLI